MEDNFRKYLTEVFKKALYSFGEEQYEKKRRLALGQDAGRNKKAYLQELDKISDDLSKKAVKELEGIGVDSADDLLVKQKLVKDKMRSVQSQMEKDLAGK